MPGIYTAVRFLQRLQLHLRGIRIMIRVKSVRVKSSYMLGMCQIR